MFTAADAQTHFDRVDVKLSRVPGARFQVRGLGARFRCAVSGAPATLEKSPPVRVTRCNLVRATARAVEGWHRSDTRRLMIAIFGRAELELVRRRCSSSRCSSSRDGFAWMKT